MKEKTKLITFMVLSISSIVIALSFLIWCFVIVPNSGLVTDDWCEIDEYIHNYIDIKVDKQHFYVNETINDNMIVTVVNYGDKNISWGDLKIRIIYADNINPGMKNPDYARFYRSTSKIIYAVYVDGSSYQLEGDLPVLLSGSTYIFNISISLDEPRYYDGATYWLDYRLGCFSIAVYDLERR